MVWKLDRALRSTRDAVNTVADLQRRGISFHSLTETVDTATPIGKLLFSLLASVAEFQAEGTAACETATHYTTPRPTCATARGTSPSIGAYLVRITTIARRFPPVGLRERTASVCHTALLRSDIRAIAAPPTIAPIPSDR